MNVAGNIQRLATRTLPQRSRSGSFHREIIRSSSGQGGRRCEPPQRNASSGNRLQLLAAHAQQQQQQQQHNGTTTTTRNLPQRSFSTRSNTHRTMRGLPDHHQQNGGGGGRGGGISSSRRNDVNCSTNIPLQISIGGPLDSLAALANTAAANAKTGKTKPSKKGGGGVGRRKMPLKSSSMQPIRRRSKGNIQETMRMMGLATSDSSFNNNNCNSSTRAVAECTASITTGTSMNTPAVAQLFNVPIPIHISAMDEDNNNNSNNDPMSTPSNNHKKNLQQPHDDDDDVTMDYDDVDDLMNINVDGSAASAAISMDDDEEEEASRGLSICDDLSSVSTNIDSIALRHRQFNQAKFCLNYYHEEEEEPPEHHNDNASVLTLDSDLKSFMSEDQEQERDVLIVEVAI